MFSKLALLSAAFMAVFVAASPTTPEARGTISNSCNTGSVQCCNSLQSADTSTLSNLHGLLSVVGTVTGLIGVSCTSLDILALSGQSCSAQTACCADNSFKGVLAFGCSPVNLNL